MATHARETAPVLTISAAAELAGIHAQTLRQYDRLGLVTPVRTKGRGRRYSQRDIQRLRDVQRMSQEEGINLEGIRRILALEADVDGLRGQVEHLTEALRAVQSSPLAARLFTAESSGAVHRGRFRPTTPPALPYRPA